MNTTSTPSNMTDGQVEKIMANVRAALLNKRSEFLSKDVQLALERGRLDAKITTSVEEALKQAIAESTGVQTQFLKLISGDQGYVINSVDGSRILAEAKDVFFFADPNFKDWKADEPGKLTEETVVRTYKMIKNATLAQMFNSLPLDLNDLCLTQSQIISFVKEHREWWQVNDYMIFFLFKSYDNFFVAKVNITPGGNLCVDVDRFECSDTWGAMSRYLIVVPQLD